MESTMVIKVKYGDSLRRFNARVDENGKLELDMSGLRAKILSLFNFPPEADIILTYIDEDGDVVTLVDDDDVLDVMRQNLKYLRIDAQLNNEKGGKSYARSSESSTPLRSPRVQHQLQNINAGVAEALKSVPEPFREALSKLSFNLASKASSSGPPVLADLVESFSKMGQSFMSLDSLSQVGAFSSTQDVVGPSNASNDAGMPVVLPKSTSIDSSSKISHDVNIGNVSRGVGAPVTPLPGSVDLNLLPSDSNPSGFQNVNFAPGTSSYPAGDKRGEAKRESNGLPVLKSVGCDASANSSVPTRDTLITNIIGNPLNECPFAGLPISNDPAVPSSGYHHAHPFKRNHSCTTSMGGLFHKNVRCDGCGVLPITGPRYKSKVKEDYDLCSICFSEMGNQTDYIRMDRPMSHRYERSLKGLYDQMNSPWVSGPPAPPVLPHHMIRGCGIKHGRPKLDSRFISDVTVMDGTMMAPSTPFTKIWRLRNSGSLFWPQGTQLVWIGGNRFSDTVSLEIETGVPAGQEIDVAVDFTAPETPGQYVSYWRMASPSGQRFGQRVWVLIQVVTSLCDSLQGLNLNLPPVSSGSKAPEIIDVNVQPAIDGEFLQPSNSNAATEPVKPVVDEQQPKKDHDLNFPINDSLLVGHGISVPATPEASSFVSYPIVDFSEDAPAAPTNAPSQAPAAPSMVPSTDVNAPTSSQGVGAENTVEETLLKELEEMGFWQVDLNKEILRMNEYNLEQSVDDLCGVSEWDPILEELQEMGFGDTAMNKRLLMKNNGSIKRVVMDLISGEKA